MCVCVCVHAGLIRSYKCIYFEDVYEAREPSARQMWWVLLVKKRAYVGRKRADDEVWSSGRFLWCWGGYRVVNKMGVECFCFCGVYIEVML